MKDFFYYYLSKNRTKDIIYFNNDLKVFKLIIDGLTKDHPNASNEQVNEYLQKFMERINIDTIYISSPRSDTIRYYAAKSLHDNYGLLKRTYEEVLNDEKENKLDYVKNDSESKTYPDDMNLARKIFIEDELKNIRKLIENYKNEMAGSNINNISAKKKNAILMEMFGSDRETARKFIDLAKGDELNALYDILSSDISELEKYVRQKNIDSIVLIGRRLNGFNELQRAKNAHNKLMKTYDMDGLKFTDEDIRNFFDEKNLNKLSLPQLASLEAFWSNRYSKVLESFSNSYFVAKSLNLIDKIRNGETIEIDDDVLNALLKKQNVLNGTYSEIFENMMEGGVETLAEQKNVINHDNPNLAIFDISENLDKMDAKIGEEYKKYFDKILPNFENDFKKDFNQYYATRDILKNMYRVKDFSISAMLHILQNESQDINWGIIQPSDGTIHSKEIIAADISGLNMPLRLHVPIDSLKKYCKTRNGNFVIPIYQGREDFNFGSRLITTNIMGILNESQKKFVQEELGNESRNEDETNFLEHIWYLADSKMFPKHISRVQCKKKKGKKIVEYKKKPTIYLDLVSGEKMRMNGKGEFESIDKDIGD